MGDRYEIWIPRWRPARLNQWDGRHWAVRARIKATDRRIVISECRSQCVAPAVKARRVSVEIVLGPGHRKCDPDAHWKSLLDALVQARALVDDSMAWCVLGPVMMRRAKKGEEWGTRIVLEGVG